MTTSPDSIAEAIYKSTEDKIKQLPSKYATAISDVNKVFFIKIIRSCIDGNDLTPNKRKQFFDLAEAYKNMILPEVRLFQDLMQQTNNWASGPKRGWNFSDTNKLNDTMNELWAKVLTKEISPSEIQPHLEKSLSNQGWLNPSFTAGEFCKDVMADILKKKFSPDLNEINPMSSPR